MIRIGRHEIALMLKELEENGIEIRSEDRFSGQLGPSAAVNFTYDEMFGTILNIRNVNLVYDRRIEVSDLLFRNFLLHEINHAWMVPRKIDYGFSDFVGNSWCPEEVDRVVEIYKNEIIDKEVSAFKDSCPGYEISNTPNFEQWIHLEYERCAIFFMMSLSYPDKVREIAPVTFGGLMDSIKSGVFGNVLQDVVSKGINSSVTKVDA